MNVANVFEEGLCCQCGTCHAVCPQSAIRLHWHPERGCSLSIDEQACNNCGLCQEVCPGLGVDFAQLGQVYLDQGDNDPYIGRFLSCHVGYASQASLRWNASSGGVVTALLIFGLRTRVFDAALVTRMSPASPLEPVSLLARTEHEVLPAMGSKYCSVATNSRLADVMAGNDRVAVVGLPCHIHGVRKAQRSIPQLKEKVVLCISLFCGMVQTLQGTLVLLKSRGIHPEEVIEIRYRGSGWPGSLQVSLRDGQTYSEPYKSYYGRYFTSFFPHRCTLCTDGVGELADISCGDAWLPEYESDDHGTSLLIARSRKGTDLLSLAVPADITLSPTTAAKVRESQEQMLTFKKRGAAARARLCLLARRRVPCYVEELPAARIIDYVDAIKFYLKHFVYRLLAGSGR